MTRQSMTTVAKILDSEGRQRIAEAMSRLINQHLSDPRAYRCFICGIASDDRDYEHTADECSVARVMGS